MKKILLFLTLISSSVFAHDIYDDGSEIYDIKVEKEAYVFWHWDTLYIKIDNHLFYCSDIQHSVKCSCFDDDDVE